MTRGNLPSLWLLSVASSLSPFGMIVVVPTLGALAAAHAITQGDAQFVIAAYLFGLGVGQPVAGALSDRFGRRPVILWGFVLFTAASAACAVATTFPLLLAFRLLQALGVSVGTVGSRAMVRDTHDALGSVRALAWIGAAMGVAPVIAPAAGGLMSRWWGPQSVFAASALLGLFTTVAMFARLGETRQAGTAPATGQHWVTNYRELLGSRRFMGYSLMYAFMQGAFFAFLAVAAVVFDHDLGIGEAGFGFTWGALGLVYIVGAAAGARLTSRSNPGRMLATSTAFIVLSGAGMLGGVALAGVTLAGLTIPLTLLMFAAGILTPVSVAGAVNCRPDIAGTAAGLSSSVALVVSGSFSMASGYVYTGDFLPVAGLVAASTAMVLVTWWMTR